MYSHEDIMEGLDTLHSSKVVFRPSVLQGLIFANFKTAEGLKEDESRDSELRVYGILKFTQIMVAKLTGLPPSDEVFITRQMLESAQEMHIEAIEFQRFFTRCFFGLQEAIDECTPDEVDELSEDKIVQGFNLAMISNFEIVVEEAKKEAQI